VTSAVLAPEFVETVEHYDLMAAVRLDPNTAVELRAVADAGGAILLGELHGVAETASVIYALMTGLGIERLALEWEPELRPLVERYLATGRFDLMLGEEEAAEVEKWINGEPAFASRPEVREALALCSLDGRVTAGHFALLRALHAENRLQQLILFQDGGKDWSDRDQAMAQRLLEEWDRKGAVLVAAGNLHTSLQPHRCGVPLGHHLAAVTDAAEARLCFTRGSLYDGRKIITLREHAPDDSSSTTSTTKGSYPIVLEEANPAIVARIVVG
jgi:hypothetical protein